MTLCVGFCLFVWVSCVLHYLLFFYQNKREGVLVVLYASKYQFMQRLRRTQVSCNNVAPALLSLILHSNIRHALIQEFTLVGVPWRGSGSEDRQDPQRVQGSARWGALGGMRIRNLRR